MKSDRNGLTILPEEECLRLLEGSHLGRVAVSIDALPVVLPVQYAMLDGAIVFRTGTGTKFDAALRDAVVAFEVDHVDPLYHTGWSVLITGRAEEIRDPEELERARALPLRPWLPSERDRFVRVSTDLVSGRLVFPQPSGGEPVAASGRSW